MLSRYLFPISLWVGYLAQSSSVPHRMDVLVQRDESLSAHHAITLRLESLQKSMEVTGVDLEEQQRALKLLRQKAAQRRGDDNEPMSKKQRRLQYVNELLSHNSDLKKQSLIKVINNLNKCGVECTLSTQGKGSHITLSVDGKKHTISSKMQIGHLKRDLEESGVDFSVSENESHMHSDQTVKEFEIRVSELSELLMSLNIDIEELQKEQQQLKDELESQKENAEEVREAYLFSVMVDSVTDLIIHRSFGRSHMIWQIYDAVMADLVYYGQQWDFQRAVKYKLIRYEDDWGCCACAMYEIRVCSTKALQTRVHYYDALAAFLELEKELFSNIPLSQLFDIRKIDMFSLSQDGMLDELSYVDLNLLDAGMNSFLDKNDRRPHLCEFRQIMNSSKMKEPLSGCVLFFGIMHDLWYFYQLSKIDLDPVHQHTLQITDLNPNDNPEYLQSTTDLSVVRNLSFDQLMKFSKLYDQCGCNLAEGYLSMAGNICVMMWERDQDQTVLFVEKLLNQGTLKQGKDSAHVAFRGIRQSCGKRLYNQAMLQIRIMHKTKQFSAAPLIDIDRSEKIYGPMWHALEGFSLNQRYIILLCLELGDRTRAIRESGRAAVDIGDELTHFWWNQFKTRFNFDMYDRESVKCRRQWISKAEKETHEFLHGNDNDAVTAIKILLDSVNEKWRNRDHVALEPMVELHEKMQTTFLRWKDHVRMQIRHPEILKELSDKLKLFEDYIKREKGETVEKKHPPKKKKTQKRGKNKKH